jgi:hypothetical protein
MAGHFHLVVRSNAMRVPLPDGAWSGLLYSRAQALRQARAVATSLAQELGYDWTPDASGATLRGHGVSISIEYEPCIKPCRPP